MAGSANPTGAMQPTQGAAANTTAYTQAANTTGSYTPAATGASPVTPPPPAGSAMPNVYNTASNLYNAAAAGPNINQFMNPYTSAVTDTTLQGLERQRQMQMNDIGAQASRAGAFGGSRHGVAEALTNQGFAEQGASTLANLNQQGFNTALNAAQAQQGIQSGLAGQGFGFGQSIGAQQTAQGQAQQQTNQALINAIKEQFGGLTGQQNDALQGLITAISGAGLGQGTTTQTNTSKPGLLSILGALAAL